MAASSPAAAARICAVDLGDAVRRAATTSTTTTATGTTTTTTRRRAPPPPCTSRTVSPHLGPLISPLEVARHCVLRDLRRSGRARLQTRVGARLFCNEILANSRPGVVVCRAAASPRSRRATRSTPAARRACGCASARRPCSSRTRCTKRVSDLPRAPLTPAQLSPRSSHPASPSRYRCTTTRTPACGRHVTPDLTPPHPPTFSGAQQRARRRVGVTGDPLTPRSAANFLTPSRPLAGVWSRRSRDHRRRSHRAAAAPSLRSRPRIAHAHRVLPPSPLQVGPPPRSREPPRGMAPVRSARRLGGDASPPRFSSLALPRYTGVVVSARGAADVTHNDVYSNWGTMGRVSDKEHGARPASRSPILPPQARASRSASTVRDRTRLGHGRRSTTRARSPIQLSPAALPSTGRARASTAICCTMGWRRASSSRRPTPPVRPATATATAATRRRHPSPSPVPPSLARSLCPLTSAAQHAPPISSSAASIEDNDVFANERPGVVVLANADPSVRGNRFRDGRENGVWVYEHGAMGRVSDTGRLTRTSIPTAHPLASPLQAADASSATNSSGTQRRRLRWPPPPVRLHHHRRPRSHASRTLQCSPHLLPPPLQRPASSGTSFSTTIMWAST